MKGTEKIYRKGGYTVHEATYEDRRDLDRAEQRLRNKGAERITYKASEAGVCTVVAYFKEESNG